MSIAVDACLVRLKPDTTYGTTKAGHYVRHGRSSRNNAISKSSS